MCGWEEREAEEVSNNVRHAITSDFYGAEVSMDSVDMNSRRLILAQRAKK